MIIFIFQYIVVLPIYQVVLFVTPTEKKNETNLFIFIHSKTMLQVIC